MDQIRVAKELVKIAKELVGERLKKALKILEKEKPKHDFVVEGPDSFDRETVRDIVLRWRDFEVG